MAFCNSCGNQVPEGVAFCPNCGSPVGGANVNTGNNAAMPVVMLDAADHTAEFNPEDIKKNKVFAMLSVLCGIWGALVTYLGARDSEYAMFYARESLKCTVLNMLVGIASAVLGFTFIVPIAGGIFAIVLVVCRVISFFTICQNMAKEMPVVRSFAFLG